MRRLRLNWTSAAPRSPDWHCIGPARLGLGRQRGTLSPPFHFTDSWSADRRAAWSGVRGLRPIALCPCVSHISPIAASMLIASLSWKPSSQDDTMRVSSAIKLSHSSQTAKAASAAIDSTAMRIPMVDAACHCTPVERSKSLKAKAKRTGSCRGSSSPCRRALRSTNRPSRLPAFPPTRLRTRHRAVFGKRRNALEVPRPACWRAANKRPICAGATVELIGR